MTKKILKTYYLVSFFAVLFHCFIVATYVLFLTDKGMDIWQISLINFIFMVSVFLLEIPTGAFADILGRKPSFVFSCFISGFGMFIYFLSGSFWSFVLAEITLAIGVTFSSGAFQAWMVDSLKYYNFKGSLDRVFSKEQQIAHLGLIAGALFGAYAAKSNLALPWLFGAVGLFSLGILAQILMKESYFVREKFQVRKIAGSVRKVVIGSINYGIKNKIVLIIVCFGIVQMFAVQASNMYWQLRFKEFISNTSYFGWIFTAICLASLIGSKIAVPLLRLVKKEKVGLLVSQLYIGFFLLLSSLFPSLVPMLIFFIVHNVGRGSFIPIKSVYLNKNIPSEKRATILSFDSMALRFGSAGGLLVSGFLAKTVSISFSWMFSGIFLILATIVIFLFSRRVE